MAKTYWLVKEQGQETMSLLLQEARSTIIGILHSGGPAEVFTDGNNRDRRKEDPNKVLRLQISCVNAQPPPYYLAQLEWHPCLLKPQAFSGSLHAASYFIFFPAAMNSRALSFLNKFIHFLTQPLLPSRSQQQEPSICSPPRSSKPTTTSSKRKMLNSSM